MRAKYAGTCAQTGKSYPAGTEIVKTTQGWVIASQSSTHDFRDMRRSSGDVVKMDITKPCYCPCAKQDPNFDITKPETYAKYQRVRTGSDFVCPVCSDVLHLISESDSFEATILPTLRLQYREGYGSPGLELSTKISAEKWQTVKQYFRYWSADDLDQCDYFDQQGGYFASEANAESIEDALGILPKNRWSNREERERIAKMQKAEALAKYENENRDSFFAEQDGKRSEYKATICKTSVSIRPYREVVGGTGLDSVATYEIATDTISWHGVRELYQPFVEKAFREWLAKQDKSEAV